MLATWKCQGRDCLKKKKSGKKGMYIKKLARDLCLLFCNMYFHVVENNAFQNS